MRKFKRDSASKTTEKTEKEESEVGYAMERLESFVRKVDTKRETSSVNRIHSTSTRGALGSPTIGLRRKISTGESHSPRSPRSPRLTRGNSVCEIESFDDEDDKETEQTSLPRILSLKPPLAKEDRLRSLHSSMAEPIEEEEEEERNASSSFTTAIVSNSMSKETKFFADESVVFVDSDLKDLELEIKEAEREVSPEKEEKAFWNTFQMPSTKKSEKLKAAKKFNIGQGFSDLGSLLEDDIGASNDQVYLWGENEFTKTADPVIERIGEKASEKKKLKR